MKAIQIKKAPLGESEWSSARPAPSTMMQLMDDIASPLALHAGDLVVKVKAASVVRDNLTWAELYTQKPAHLGNDFAGIVTESLSEEFKPGDEVYGMVAADRGGTWSEYVLVRPEEVCKKPKGLSWEEGAALPLSALTADQALCVHAGVDAQFQRRVLVTGATGAVGTYLIQFALAAGQEVVGATSSNTRNAEFLRSLNIETSIQYSDFEEQAAFDIIVDTVGGEVLRSCWALLKEGGTLISIDSASWNFVEDHRALGISTQHTTSKAVFFIVEPSKASLQRISRAVEQGGVQVLVSKTFPLAHFQQAYDFASSRNVGRGRVVLVF